jgi:hypothetical protein
VIGKNAEELYKMNSYTLWEQETIINYNQADDMADIYTHDKPLQRHIEKDLGIKPYAIVGPARSYKVSKSWLKWPRKPSEKRRESARKALKARGGRIGKTPALVG